MHEIEPFFNWRDHYGSEEDELSPFFNREYSEFYYSNTIYNYYIHPQWDGFGSATLYVKTLFADYDLQVAVIEMLGEWNDCLYNDIMFFKREVIEPFQEKGINQFILIGENVLNFHGSDDCYYEEWYEEICGEGGWVALINFREHVTREMETIGIGHYVHFGGDFDAFPWRNMHPKAFYRAIENRIIKSLNP